MIKKVFIDGEEGTTGLQIYERLEKHPNIEVIKIDPNKRKNLLEKKEIMKKADLVFYLWELCKLTCHLHLYQTFAGLENKEN